MRMGDVKPRRDRPIGVRAVDAADRRPEEGCQSYYQLKNSRSGGRCDAVAPFRSHAAPAPLIGFAPRCETASNRCGSKMQRHQKENLAPIWISLGAAALMIWPNVALVMLPSTAPGP